MNLQEKFDEHTPWKIVHWVISGLITIKGIVFATLALTLGIVE
jgi:hypothetical protein